MSGTLIRVNEEMTFYLSSLVSLDDILFPSYIESYPSKKKIEMKLFPIQFQIIVTHPYASTNNMHMLSSCLLLTF